MDGMYAFSPSAWNHRQIMLRDYFLADILLPLICMYIVLLVCC